FFASDEFFDDRRAGATAITFDASGHATITGTAQNHDDKQFFSFTPTASGTVQLTVTSTNGRLPDVEVENGRDDNVLELEDGQTSGSFAVTAGQTYFIRVRATGDQPSAFRIDLTFTAATT